MRPLVIGMGWFPAQPGGLNRFVRALDVALRSEGVTPHTLVLGPADDAPPGVEAVAAGDARLPRRILAFARAARRRVPECDVVDFHFALYAVVPLVAGTFRRLPVVAHYQGPWAAEGRAAGDGRLEVLLKRRVEGIAYRRATAVVTLSAAFKRLVVERCTVAPWDVIVMPPGVDAELFSPGPREEARRRLDLPVDAWIAVSPRRLTPRMGLDVLLDAWAGMGEDDLLVLAGDGSERGALEERARSAGERVRFTGRVADSELVDLYRAADVCVVPSVALEGFALVGLEALACGTPVVATRVGGMAEWLGRLDADCLVAAGNAAALRRRLGDARSGRVPLPSPTACRAFAESFSWREAAARHARLYADVTAPAPERRLRVVYVDHCARLSGGELALLRLVEALPVDAHVILGEDGPLAERLRLAGISHEVLALPAAARETPRWSVSRRTLVSRQGLESAVYALRLARRLRRYRPDLVHANSLKACAYGSVAARLAGVPVIWHVRDRLAPDYLPAPAIRMLNRVGRSLVDAIVANSAATKAALPRGLDATVIPSPVPAASRAGGSGNGFVVGLVGRLAPWKGQDLFLEAFARAFPSGDARAVLVGAALFGEHEYERQLREQCATLGLDGRVAFAGFRDDVAAELAQFDALVHASVTPEPFGLAVAEGMAAGLAVIAPGAGGPAEMIEDGVSGILYRPGDAAALASALRTVAGDPELRRRIGMAARERVRAFAPDVVAAQTMDVYRRVAARA